MPPLTPLPTLHAPQFQYLCRCRSAPFSSGNLLTFCFSNAILASMLLVLTSKLTPPQRRTLQQPAICQLEGIKLQPAHRLMHCRQKLQNAAGMPAATCSAHAQLHVWHAAGVPTITGDWQKWVGMPETHSTASTRINRRSGTDHWGIRAAAAHPEIIFAACQRLSAMTPPHILDQDACLAAQQSCRCIRACHIAKSPEMYAGVLIESVLGSMAGAPPPPPERSGATQKFSRHF